MLAAFGPSASATVAPRKSASTLVVGSTLSVQKLDPQVATNFLDLQALGLNYETLVKFNQQLQVVPDLATSWKFSGGSRVLTFMLRKGVKFADGHTFTSADVAATIKRVQNPKTGAAAASYVSTVKQVVRVGPYEVRFLLSRPDTSIIDGLTSMNLAMLSSKAIAAGTVAKKPDGTGAFTFVSWSPDNSYTVRANPNFWGGKPSIGTVEIKTIPSEQSIASALQAHTVQLALLTQPQVANHLPSAYKVLKVLDLSYRAMMLQDLTGPLANVNNRLAIACAVNRTQVLGASVFGQGKVVGPVPVGQFASNPVSAVCPTPDLTKARSYLRQAGNANGFSFTAITSTDLDPSSNAQAITVQANLAQVGITMNIQNLAGDAYIQDWLKGQFQAAFAYNGANPDPYTMYGRYFGPGANLSVPAGYSSSALQKLIVSGDSAASTATRTKIWAQLSNNLTSNAVWIWLFDSFDYAVLAPGVKGFQISPTRSLQSLAQTTVS
ncbi:MAG TPA: ABC transporter substrate-binding protein [Acidimicrobiales bacterium]|nr:ABC transporter substrate-binding protein [Acidimicrobiales bacterium]